MLNSSMKNEAHINMPSKTNYGSSILVSFLLYSGKRDKGICPSSHYCIIIMEMRSADTWWVLKVTNWNLTSLLCSSNKDVMRKYRDREAPNPPTHLPTTSLADYLTALEVALPLSSQFVVPPGARHLKWVCLSLLGGRNPASSWWEIHSWGGTLSTSWGW